VQKESVVQLGVLVVILLIGISIRFWGITERGVYYHDEAGFLASARFYGGLLRSTSQMVLNSNLNLNSLSSQAEKLYHLGGTPAQTAKPLFYAILIIPTAIFGSTDLIALTVSAIAGVITILVIAKIGTWISSPISGLTAAALLSISVWHTHYSRSGLSQAVSLLIVCLAMGVLIKYQLSANKSIRELFLVSFLAGLAFTSHYNLFWLPLLVGGWLAWIIWNNAKNLWDWLKNLALSAAMMIIPLLLFEIPYRIVIPIAQNRVAESVYSEKTQVFATYVEQIIFQLNFNSNFAEVGSEPTFILEIIARLESLPFLVSLLIGLLFLIYRSWRKDQIALLLFLWALIPWAIWALFGFKGPRSYLPMLPPLLLGAGLFIDSMWTNFNNSPRAQIQFLFVLVLFAAVLVLTQFNRLLPLMQARSAWKVAAEQILRYQETHGNRSVADAELSGYNQPIFRFYLQNIIDREKSTGDLLIIDGTSNRWIKEEYVELTTNCDAIISVPNDLDSGMIMEEALYDPFPALYRSGKIPHRIVIYDTQSCQK
jgi:hypothetical protein